MTAELERIADALEAEHYGAGPPHPLFHPTDAERAHLERLVELVRFVVDPRTPKGRTRK